MAATVMAMSFNSCSDEINEEQGCCDEYVVDHSEMTVDKRVSTMPTYFGNISAIPQLMQNVLHQRFVNTTAMDEAELIFVGKNELTETEITALEAKGKIVVTAGSNTVMSRVVATEDDALPVFLEAYSSNNSCYTMYGENDVNSVELDEDYFHNRVTTFIEWIGKKKAAETSTCASAGTSKYEDFKASIDTDGQQFVYDYGFTLSNIIDTYGPSGTSDWLRRSGSVSVEYRVYPMYILSSNTGYSGDYYGVTCNVTPHNNSMWGAYKENHFWSQLRIYGYWFNTMDIETSLVTSDGKDITDLRYCSLPIPENANSSASYTNGYTFSVSGGLNAGIGGGKPATAGGNVTFGGAWQSTVNYTLQTINFVRDSSTPTCRYHYYTENVNLSDDWDNMNGNFPMAVRSEFTGHLMWVWYVPSTKDNDNDTRFMLKSKLKLSYSSWYHWRSAVEYDSNRRNYDIDVPEKVFKLASPDRSTWGLISLKNAAPKYQMANVAFYRQGKTTPTAEMTNSFAYDDSALQALPEGTYDVYFDFVDGNTNEVVEHRKCTNIQVHQAKTKDAATCFISTVNSVVR